MKEFLKDLRNFIIWIFLAHIFSDLAYLLVIHANVTYGNYELVEAITCVLGGYCLAMVVTEKIT